MSAQISIRWRSDAAHGDTESNKAVEAKRSCSLLSSCKQKESHPGSFASNEFDSLYHA